MKKEPQSRRPAGPAQAALDSPDDLQREAALLRAIINGTPELVCVRDAEGRTVMTNPSYEKLLGASQGQLRGKTVEELFAPEEAAEMRASDERVLASGRAEAVEEIVTTPSGQRVLRTAKSPHRDEHGAVTGVLSLATEITDFKEVEGRLLRAKERYEMAARAVSGFIYEWDPARGTVERTGDLASVLGYSLAEAAPNEEWWREQIHPDDAARAAEYVKAALAEGEQYAIEYRVRHRDGHYVYVWDRGLILRDSAGRAVRVVGNTSDITGRKEVELINTRLLIDEQKARQAAELANRAKDEFLAIVSHELRAPLSAMLGWAKILKGGKYTPESFKHAVEIIERSARTQQKIIEDLLDSARIVRGDLRLEVRPVDLGQVARNVLETHKPAMEAKGLALELALAQEVDPINGDPDRLQQVIWNLVSNAVKFTPQGGLIGVRLERVDPYIQLTVSDTGKGISPDVLPLIFERFRQADSSTTRRHGGLGLGLSLVKHLVELHGGTVAAESPGEGKGATFRVNLPVRAVRVSTAEEAPKSVRRKSARPLEGVRVLVIDDESDAREMVATMLEQNGARATIADSVAAALAAFQREARHDGQPPFDVVVSDLGMPKEDGYTFVRRLRSLSPEQGGSIPAIALTAYGRAEDRIRVLAAGFQTHVLKPVEPAELVIVIANLTGRGKMSGRK